MQKITGETKLTEEIAQILGGEHLQICYSCGTCVSRCIIPWRDPAYNPRRVLHKAAMDMRKEVFEDITIWYCTACDLCYPSCPQEIHISEVIGALRQLALGAGYISPVETVSVNPVLCVGCGNCVEICPYEALKLEIRGNARVSSVDHNHCMGCGGCVSACPNNAISGGIMSNEAIQEQLDHVLYERL